MSRGCLHNHDSSCTLSSCELQILQSKSIEKNCGCMTSFVCYLPIVLELMQVRLTPFGCCGACTSKIASPLALASFLMPCSASEVSLQPGYTFQLPRLDNTTILPSITFLLLSSTVSSIICLICIPSFSSR
jgi:hypothetical protein